VFGLTTAPPVRHKMRMLRYNEARSRPVHLLHALSAGVHVLCCGAPLLVQIAGLSVAAAGMASLHAFLHGREWAVLAFSAALFALGLLLERRPLRLARPSPLLMLSAVCLVANLLVLGAHRLSGL